MGSFRHVFCADCLFEWVDSTADATCPTCRQSITLYDVIYIDEEADRDEDAPEPGEQSEDEDDHDREDDNSDAPLDLDTEPEEETREPDPYDQYYDSDSGSAIDPGDFDTSLWDNCMLSDHGNRNRLGSQRTAPVQAKRVRFANPVASVVMFEEDAAQGSEKHVRFVEEVGVLGEKKVRFMDEVVVMDEDSFSSRY